MYNFLSEKDEFPHLNKKMISLETLISAIEDLDCKNIISFEEFKNLSYLEIKKRFFLMPNPTSIRKAIIKIEDKRAGKTSPSSYTTIDEYYKGNVLVSIKEKTIFF